jgi:uncharacterized protein
MFNAIDHSIIYAYRGSIAHNLQDGPIDDIDTMGVCIAPLEYYLGLKRFEQFEKQPTEEDNKDIVVYDIKKYFNLLLKSNPNVISLLWNHPDMYIHKTELGQKLIDNRSIFSSQQAFKSFYGYAYSQLKKMTHRDYKGYMGAKRKSLVDQHGYDTKNACHLIRLLKMGVEFLQTGELTVFREEDRDFLLSIKRGEFSFEQIQRLADKGFASILSAKEYTSLPINPNYKKAESLLMEIMYDYFNIKVGEKLSPPGDETL